MNRPSEERVQAGSRQWLCVTCGLVLKEEAVDPKSVLGRVPVRRLSQSELAAAKAADERAARAAAEKAAAEKAAKAAAARAKAGPADFGGIDIDFGEAANDFEIEMQGETKRISGSPEALAAAAPSEFDAALDEAFAEHTSAPQAPAPAPARAQARARTAAPAPVPAAAPDPAPAPSGVLFERVIVAEDTALLREITKDALTQAGVAKHVKTCANAVEMLQIISESLSAGLLVDLAILDLDLPLLNGQAAAVALRAFETGMKSRPTPLIFFTAYPCDDRLKKCLEYCQPARYLNKGADGAPERIAARLVQVLSSLRR